MIFNNKQDFLNSIPSTGILIGLDIGTKNVGIAITDESRKMALPLKIISLNIKEIIDTLQSYKAVGIVIGFPLSMNGENNEQCKFVETIAHEIQALSHIPIYLCDERLSTRMANSMLKIGNIKRKERNKVDDMVSATIILENVLL